MSAACKSLSYFEQIKFWIIFSALFRRRESILTLLAEGFSRVRNDLQVSQGMKINFKPYSSKNVQRSKRYIKNKVKNLWWFSHNIPIEEASRVFLWFPRESKNRAQLKKVKWQSSEILVGFCCLRLSTIPEKERFCIYEHARVVWKNYF